MLFRLTILLLASCYSLASQPTNLDVIRQGVSNQLESIVQSRPIRGVNITNHPDAMLLTALATAELNKRQWLDTTAATSLILIPVDVSTSYKRVGPDMMERHLTVNFSALWEGAGNAMEVTEPFRFVDTVSRATLPFLDSRQHMATTAAVPPEPLSWWEHVAEPVVYVGAAVVTAVLLFTVRSK